MCDVQQTRNKRSYDDLRSAITNKMEEVMYECNKKTNGQDGNRI